MPDTVYTQILIDTEHRFVAMFCGHSDGTGESNVIKIDASTLKNAANNGTERLVLNGIWWTVHSKDQTGHIDIDWVGSPNSPLFQGLSGNGTFNLKEKAVTIPPPESANGLTGDVSFTTHDWKVGDGYTIILDFTKLEGYSNIAAY